MARNNISNSQSVRKAWETPVLEVLTVDLASIAAKPNQANDGTPGGHQNS